MSFQNKVVIVTGASSGIGAATAIAFAGEGAKVAMVGRNTVKLQGVAQQCELKGSKPLVIVADIAEKEQVKRVLDDTLKEFGKLDILVNNAGILPIGGILSPNAMEVYHKVMSTNLDSVVYLTHLAAPRLIETKGNIINVSSVAGIGVAVRDAFAYLTSKAGMDHFTRSIALELASRGVRANTVNPGPVRTDLLADNKTAEEVDATYAALASWTPLKRVSEPQDIADLILFLASDRAKSITGSSFVADNGVLLIGAP